MVVRKEKKKGVGKRGETATYTEERGAILLACYGRLQEIIPQCTNETTLLKCIEMLEKQPISDSSDETADVIGDTVERLLRAKEPLK